MTGTSELQFVVSLLGRIRVDASISDVAAHEAIEAHLDAVMDELDVLGAIDPSIELNLDVWQVAFSVLVKAANPVDAANGASGLLRSAIHAAGGGTPDWPDPNSKVWSVQLLEVSSKVVSQSAPGGDDNELVGA